MVSDIDNTLTGDAGGIRQFAEWRRDHPEVAFAVATGRHLESARALLAEWDVPEPDLFVTAVGSEIDRPTARGFRSVASWHRRIAPGWDRSAIRAVADAVPGLVAQPQANQGTYKISYYADDAATRARKVKAQLGRLGMAATVIGSHGIYLDILPSGASKGTAALHAARLLGAPIGRIIAAGDSGNDRALLEAASYPILVANHLAELTSFTSDVEARLWRSTAPAARGLVEGVDRALRAIGPG